MGPLFAIGVAFAQPLLACECERPAISLLVYNHAQAPFDVLNRARQEVSRIFQDAGVATVWTDPAASPAPVILPDNKRSRTYTIQVIVRRQVLLLRGDSLKSHFGVALLGGERDDHGGTALVSFDDVSHLARDKRQDVGTVLAYVIAHEMGHLLLPAPTHSKIGIMRPDWNADDLRQIERGFMSFTPLQARLIAHRVNSCGSFAKTAGDF